MGWLRLSCVHAASPAQRPPWWPECNACLSLMCLLCIDHDQLRDLLLLLDHAAPGRRDAADLAELEGPEGELAGGWVQAHAVLAEPSHALQGTPAAARLVQAYKTTHAWRLARLLATTGIARMPTRPPQIG